MPIFFALNMTVLVCLHPLARPSLTRAPRRRSWFHNARRRRKDYVDRIPVQAAAGGGKGGSKGGRSAEPQWTRPAWLRAMRTA
jgi:hypothetical protein